MTSKDILLIKNVTDLDIGLYYQSKLQQNNKPHKKYIEAYRYRLELANKLIKGISLNKSDVMSIWCTLISEVKVDRKGAVSITELKELQKYLENLVTRYKILDLES